MRNVIFGYTDILTVGTRVQVVNTEHISTVSEVVELFHCTIYRLENPIWELNWHFRIYLKTIN
jgi:hypothetical protein